ncbi:helix-turn-helix domain-containing protein [Gordonia zhaorongruii]|uniref:helix-turn-helix domain-containing protein n=1 Tax=Gordonia zhaorongruii TaxID=2597659 RepID=UPI001643382E|nr:helix-turn-helix domain-containing protein [Gordonia zhaorongruii]
MTVPAGANPDYSATLSDIAREFGISYRTVRRYVAAGLITGHRIGPKLIRFNIGEVREQLLGNAGSTRLPDPVGNEATRRADASRARRQFGLPA